MKKLLALVFCLLALPALAQDRNSATHWRIGTTQTISTTSSSAQASSTVSNYVYVIRVIGTTDFHLAIGVSPQTAATTNMLIPAYTPEYFQVSGGEAIAAIRASANGTVYITEMLR